jgi:hypothetical protein
VTVTPALWIGIITVGLTAMGTAVGLLVHVVKTAFFMGSLKSEVDQLKSRPESDCKTELAALNATLTEFKNSMLQRVQSLETSVRDSLVRHG